MLARSPFDTFDGLLAGALTYSSGLSHVPLLSGYDEDQLQSTFQRQKGKNSFMSLSKQLMC